MYVRSYKIQYYYVRELPRIKTIVLSIYPLQFLSMYV